MIKKLWEKWMHEYRGKYFYLNIIKAPKNFYKFCKELNHFLKYGYPYEAVYSMDFYFIKLFSSILKDYRKNHWGYPSKFEEYNTEEDVDAGNKQWEKIIDQMIWYLEQMNDEEETYKEDSEVKNAFFELFSEHFYDLWD